MFLNLAKLFLLNTKLLHKDLKVVYLSFIYITINESKTSQNINLEN